MSDRHEDDRGLIEDLLIEPFDGVTHIFTHKNKIRGNHRHQATKQWTYVIKGQLRIATEEKDGTRHDSVYLPGQIAVELPGTWHAWQALEDTDVLVFTSGPRTGEGYESDTERSPGKLL